MSMSSFAKWITVVVTSGWFVSVPFAAFAQQATHDQVVSAMAEGVRRGVCSANTKKFGDDCDRTEFVCQGQDWKTFWSRYYRLIGPTVVATESNSAGPYEALEWLRASWSKNSAVAPPSYFAGTCYCGCPAGATFEPCKGKPEGTPFRTAENLTLEQCVQRCKPNQIASKCAGTLPPVSGETIAKGAAASFATYTDDATCFKPDECAGQGGIFEAYGKCPQGKGRCYAIEPAITLGVPIGGVTQVQGINNYIVTAYRYLISVGAVAATVAFVFGAFLYLLGSALPQITRGKQYMVDAVVGLLLILGANMILRTINPATTHLNPVKVYMFNTIQFLSESACADLGDVKTALAGEKPAIRPYEEVAKDPKNFSIPAKQTECGKSYWVEGAIGSACDGNACPSGEGCLSCADGTAPGCTGIASDKRVCGKAIFTGIMNYSDHRAPTEVYLMLVCNHAQNTDPSAVKANVVNFKMVSPVFVGRSMGTAKTDKKEIGQAGYSFDFNANQLAEAMDECKGKGGFRGAVLGIQYNTDVPLQLIIGLDDFAALSKRNCGSGKFDGYADGSFSRDFTDVTKAFACGVAQKKFLDDPQHTNYWSAQELQDALNGKTIQCNFNLSGANAPSNPGTAFCGEGGEA
ncbi:MAG TPA: hypothetical protein VN397_03205 [Candidatus Methylomirabilis sp.]|nr:hypothetical protein [Candidatus Methylomirabilis sp.]